MKLTIAPDAVTLDVQGYQHTRWSVRLPANVLPEDVRDPAIWRQTQATRGKSFRQHDEVLLIGTGFVMIAHVSEARADSAVLTPIKLIGTEQARTTPLFNDGRFRVIWLGTGYGVERIADGRLEPGTHANEGAAIASINARGAA